MNQFSSDNIISKAVMLKLAHDILFLSATLFFLGVIGEALIPGILSNRLFFLIMSLLIIGSISLIGLIEAKQPQKRTIDRKEESKKSYLLFALLFISLMFFLWANRQLNLVLTLTVATLALTTHYFLLKSKQ